MKPYAEFGPFQILRSDSTLPTNSSCVPPAGHPTPPQPLVLTYFSLFFKNVAGELVNTVVFTDYFNICFVFQQTAKVYLKFSNFALVSLFQRIKKKHQNA